MSQCVRFSDVNLSLYVHPQLIVSAMGLSGLRPGWLNPVQKDGIPCTMFILKSEDRSIPALFPRSCWTRSCRDS